MALRIAYLLPLFSLLLISPVKGNIRNEKKSSTIESIKRLIGCEKGSQVQGLHQLKLYLARFGYLQYQRTLNHINLQDDKFDEELEAALKSYQKFYHLNATGILDAPTISQMVIPRCGQQDIITHHHGPNSLPTISLYAFFQNNPKWPSDKAHLTYAFSSDFPDVHIPPVVRAFNQWASASNYFTFSKVDDITSADLKIRFVSGSHGDPYPFDGHGGVLAHAFAPTNGMLHFDADETWSDGPGAVPDAIDFESVSVHEIGHLLGLAHSQDRNAAMYSGIPPGVVKGLNSDDIQGIKALYGLP